MWLCSPQVMAQIRQCWDTMVVQQHGWSKLTRHRVPFPAFLARHLVDQGFTSTEKGRARGSIQQLSASQRNLRSIHGSDLSMHFLSDSPKYE